MRNTKVTFKPEHSQKGKIAYLWAYVTDEDGNTERVLLGLAFVETGGRYARYRLTGKSQTFANLKDAMLAEVAINAAAAQKKERKVHA